MSSDFLMDNRCFACGAENLQGLRLKIIDTPAGVKASVKLASHFQGYTRIVHGGIVSTILDEMAVWAAYKKGYRSATAELSVRLKKPMHIGKEYDAFGIVTRVKHKLIYAAAEIKDAKDEIIATAVVKLIELD